MWTGASTQFDCVISILVRDLLCLGNRSFSFQFGWMDGQRMDKSTEDHTCVTSTEGIDLAWLYDPEIGRPSSRTAPQRTAHLTARASGTFLLRIVAAHATSRRFRNRGAMPEAETR